MMSDDVYINDSDRAVVWSFDLPDWYGPWATIHRLLQYRPALELGDRVSVYFAWEGREER